jgi:sugar lactone lactonase YvrE
MRLPKPSIAIVLLGILLFFAQACSKNGSTPPANPPPPPVPTITAISPTSGPFNTAVTITGTNFSATGSDDTVKFNGAVATVQSATATSIVAIVPVGADTGVVTVTVNAKTATGPVFDYIYTYTLSTLAGDGNLGYVDGAGASAEFKQPTGVAVDGQGNVYVVDTYNNVIRKITASGVVSTLAGSTIAGYVDGPASSAEFLNPFGGIAVDGQGNVYVTDTYNNNIRKITSSGDVSTFAGKAPGGWLDGSRLTAEFYLPAGAAFDGRGNLYIGDAGNSRIRIITTSGQVGTVAGIGVAGFADGVGPLAAEFNNPYAVIVDPQGNVYVADATNNRIRKITPSETVSTFAGNGTAGFADGPAAGAEFNTPVGLGLDSLGNLYVSDYSNQRIRKITPSGIVSTLAGNGTVGFADGPAASAEFRFPYGIAVDPHGNVYVAEYFNNRVRKISKQ